MSGPVSVAAIAEAARTIDPVFRNTPQYISEALSEAIGARVITKVETANPIGSFKGRGADWWAKKNASITEVMCASAGNFGQAVAYCGRRAGMTVTVYAAETANPAKIMAMKRLGANVVLYGVDLDEAKAQAMDVAATRGITFVEDGKVAEITEGAGTIGSELSQWESPISRVYVPVGNGALIGGVGAWFKAHSPETVVVGVCAAGAPSMERSWREQKTVSTDDVNTIADGIAIREPIEESMPPLHAYVDQMLLVSDAEVIEAMQMLYKGDNLVAEPSGAVSLAAALQEKSSTGGQTLATLVCGSNIDPAGRSEWLTPTANA